MPDNKDVVAINLKLERGIRRDFKKKAKSVHNKSMQEVLSAFILSYNSNPGQFDIQTVLGVKGNGPTQSEPGRVEISLHQPTVNQPG